MLSQNERKRIIALINREVVPAIGCTEPIAVALCTARAAELLGSRPEKVAVRLSANILKNAMGVGIPGTGMIGLPIAVALGVVVALSSFLVAYVSGNLLDVVIKVVNLVVAPLFVLFFMALFVPWATSRGTVAGGLFAMLIAVLIAFVGIFGITALWIMPVALVSGVLSSMLFSLLDRWLIGRGLLPGK